MLLTLVCAAVVVLPGLLVARAAGVSGWTGAGAAPLITYGIVAAGGPASSAVGIPWRPATMVAATCALAGVCWSIRSLARQRSAPGVTPAAPPTVDRRGDRVVTLGVLAGAVLGAVTIRRALRGLDSVHQGWDAGFHANAIRFITDTGDAAPSALGAINNYEDATFFYPNAQHILTSIVGQLTGASVPALLNVQMMLLPGIAGLGLAVLIRAFGGRVALAASVPLVLASFTGFPYGLLSRGPLLPYATGAALVPAFLALLNRALDQRSTSAVLATAIAGAGLLAVHPSSALTAAIFTVALLVHRWRSGRTNARGREVATLLGVAVVGLAAGFPFVVGTIGIGEGGAAVDWPARKNAWEAFSGLVTLNQTGDGPQLLLVGLFAVGVWALRDIRQLWWWLAGASVFAALFVTVSSTDAPLTETLTQPWWNDKWRLLALVSLSMAVVAAHGVVVVGDALAALANRRLSPRATTSRLRVGVATVAVLATFGAISNVFYLGENEAEVNNNYRSRHTVTPDEQTAMRRLAELTGPDERVMNDPGDGSAWMYALEGIRPIFGHVIEPATYGSLGHDQQLLLSSFHCLDSSPAVRALVDKYDIHYVFTGRGFLRAEFTRVPGLLYLGAVDSLELVYAWNGTAIYRVRLSARPSASARGLGCEEITRSWNQPRMNLGVSSVRTGAMWTGFVSPETSTEPPRMSHHWLKCPPSTGRGTTANPAIRPPRRGHLSVFVATRSPVRRPARAAVRCRG